MHVIIILSLLSFITFTTSTDINIYPLQVFAIPIVPQYFNWTSDNGRNEYRYEASLLNSPDLPSWIHYTYSKKTHRGYLYGVAPKDQKNFILEITALNKKTYETRQKIIEVIVTEHESISKYQIQLKVNNWNVEDMFDRERTETFFEVFRKNVWKNATDLQLTFVAPAVELGARYPLKPGGDVGTVLRLGSSMPFSNDLQSLEKELEPIMKKFTTCDFKKVSFDRYFIGFEFDWCYFRLIEESYGLREDNTNRNTSTNIIALPPTTSSSNTMSERSEWQWSRPHKSRMPIRNYHREIFTSVFVSVLLLLLLVGLLSAALCLHHDKLIVSNRKRSSSLIIDNSGMNGVQMIQYTTTSSSRGAPHSLSTSQTSYSPTPYNSQSVNRSPRNTVDQINTYVRPNPPPYISSNSLPGTGIRADF